jgi:RNA polymerase sigma factor (sigma-70 family)
LSSSFATTRWSLILDAARKGTGDTAIAGRALADLCAHYRPPVLAHALRRGLSAPDAEDAVQGFFAKLLRLDSLATVRREHGRFRAFLLGAFNHHLADLRDHDRAAKRGAHLHPTLDAESHHRAIEGATDAGLAPDRAFDRAWALTLLQAVTERLRAEQVAAGRAEHFDALAPCLGGRVADVPQTEIAIRLGLSEPALRVALHRLRQRYRQLLREEIAHTVARPEDIDDELRHLINSVAG